MTKLWLAAALLSSAAGARAAGTYDVFSTAALGTARTVALGGAAVAVDPDGYEAVFANPAAMSGMAGEGLDFGSDGNTVDNVVVDLNDPNTRALDTPLRYSYGGARYVTKAGWGIGAGVSTPFNADDFFNGTTKIVRRQPSFVATGDQNDVHVEGATYALGGGKSFLDGRLGVGVNLNYTQATTKYSYTPVVTPGAPFARTVTDDSYASDFGVLVRPRKWLRVGLLYKMGYRVAFDDSLNKGLPVAFTAFRDLKVPDRLMLGVRLAPYDSLRVFLQGRVVFGMSDTLVTGSNSFPGTPGNTVATGRSTTLDGGWGVEYVPYDVDDLTIRLRGGGYFENTGIEGGYTRYHRTAGFAFEPWFLSFSMAIDSAEFYDNFVVGVGVDLLGVAKRMSRTYGWNLPL